MVRGGGICLLSVVYLLCWQFSNSQHLHNARACCYPWGKGCHPGEPRQAGGMCWQEPYESQQGQVQGPAPGKDKPAAAVPTWAWLGEQLCWKAPGHLGRQGASRVPWQQRGPTTSWAVWTGAEAGDRGNWSSPPYSALIRLHLEYYVHFGYPKDL